MIEITFTEEGLWEAAVYFIGLYSQLTEKKIALIEVQPNEIETYQDTIIYPPNTMQDMKFKVPKQKFSDKMQLKFDLLENFIFKQCILDEEYKILEMPLLLAFSHHINSIVDPKHKFSFLMNLFTSKYSPYKITKTTTGKGVMYKGITLMSQQANQKKTNKPSKSKKITNTINNPKPINFESLNLQSSTNHSADTSLNNLLNSPLINIQPITQSTPSLPTITLSKNISFPVKLSSLPINLPVSTENKLPILPSIVIPTFQPVISTLKPVVPILKPVVPTFQPSIMPTFQPSVISLSNHQ